MPKSGKEKFYLISFAIFVLAAVLVWQGIINGRISIDRGINEIKDKNVTIAAYGMREKTLKTNLENYNFARDKTEEMNKNFVDENNLPDFIKEIENISDQTSNELNIEFTNNSGVIKGKVPNSNDSYVLKLNLSGTFDNLMQFIARLESSPYYSYIDSIMISAEPSSSGSKFLNKAPLSVNLRTILTIRIFKKQNFNGRK